MMRNEELTPWFPPEIKPVRPGIYIASVARREFYRRWDGERWYYGDYTVEAAKKRRKKWPLQVPLLWRGLNYDPSAKGGAK